MADLLSSPLAAGQLLSPTLHWWSGAVLFGLWLFAMGASVGSFLNVVIYRLPAGLNLSRPGSRCPSCLHPIRIGDNVPVLGWLRLGGRCRDCGATISARYVLLELLFGGVVLSLGLLEIVELGLNLPDPPLASQRASPNAFSPLALGLCLVLHCAWLATLLAAAVMQGDRARAPSALFAPVVLLALFATTAFPELRPIPAFPFAESQLRLWLPQAGPALHFAVSGVFDSLVSAAVTAIAGVASPWGVAKFSPNRGVREFPWVLTLVSAGLVCGWQWAGWVLAVGGIAWLCHSLSARLLRLPPVTAPAGWYWIASLAGLWGWCWLHDLLWRLWISERARDYDLPLGLLAAGVLLAWAAAASSPAEEVRPQPTTVPKPAPASETANDAGCTAAAAGDYSASDESAPEPPAGD